MGDRANVKVIVEGPEGPQGIYLYTHWSGSEWPERLRQALQFGKGRWGDDQYLMRVLTSQMFSDIHDGETGGGVSLVIGDGGYVMLTANLLTQTVSFEGDPKEFTFAEYIAQDEASWPKSEDYGDDEDD